MIDTTQLDLTGYRVELHIKNNITVVVYESGKVRINDLMFNADDLSEIARVAKLFRDRKLVQNAD